MWKFYDTLLDGIDEDEVVADFLAGSRWSVVLSSSGNIGIAPVIMEQEDRFGFSCLPEKGMSIKELASHIRSWNFIEASLAAAAINAYYNRSQRADTKENRSTSPKGVHRVLPGGRRARQSFRSFCEENTVKGVTMLAEPLYDHEELSEMPGRMIVLRRETSFRDYFITAYREKMTEADRLVLNGKTIIEKTAEPMIECAKENGTEVFLFGPDVPLCPALLQQGISSIWSLIIDQPEELMRIAVTNFQRDVLLKLGHFEVISIDQTGRNL